MDQFLGSSSQDRLAVPKRGGKSLTTGERQAVDLSNTIRGWGSDLDPAVRPGVPMDKAPNLGAEHLYIDVTPQVPRFKIHKSSEHARLTPVFGTSCPPSGLSGLIRDFAYNYSEGRMTHWLLLMLADRINVAEDLLVEISTLRIPNIPKEMGFNAELKYNKKGVAKGALVLGVGLIALAVMMRAGREREQR